MTVRKFTMNPDAILSARSLNAIRGGESTSETKDSFFIAKSGVTLNHELPQ